MKHSQWRAVLGRSLIVFLSAAALVAPAYAARVGILTNRYAAQTAADFGSRIPSHTFSGIDTSLSIPTLQSLLGSYDVLLVFEDMTYTNAPAVGSVAAAFAKTGRAVVIGAFYEQDRSDGPALNSPHGWGDLETLDPNTSDGTGTPYAPRALDVATMRPHPLTAGITSLTSAKFAGGNNAKPGTVVLATWTMPNALGSPDPAIAFRRTDAACVIHLAIAPNYPVLSVAGTDYSGDFHRAWQNAFDFGAGGCLPPLGQDPGGDPANVPTLSEWGLILTLLMVGGFGALALRRGGLPARGRRRPR